MPFVSIEKDNSHGVGDIACRFSFVLLALLYDFDYLNIGSPEAGCSSQNGVESIQSVVGRAVNARPFSLPLLSPENASPEELTAAAHEVMRLVCERADGSTCKAGGGCLTVKPARSQLLRSGFVWRLAELARFLEAAKSGKANSFEFEPIVGFPAYKALVLRAWLTLNAIGPLACTKCTAHTFQFKKNPLNPVCLPPRDTSGAFFQFLDLFGGWLPQPIPNRSTPPDAKKSYLRLHERILDENRRPTGVDEYYPKDLMDKLVENDKLKLMEKYCESPDLPDGLLEKLAEYLFVEMRTLKYDLAERAAKAENVKKYKTLVDRQKQDGTMDTVRSAVVPSGSTRIQHLGSLVERKEKNHPWRLQLFRWLNPAFLRTRANGQSRKWIK